MINKFNQNGFAYINNKDISNYLRQIRNCFKNFPKILNITPNCFKNFNKLKKKLFEIQKNIEIKPLKKDC